MHVHWVGVFVCAWPLRLAAAGTLHTGSTANTPGNVVNCTSQSAAIQNLTAYGTEILYTVTPSSAMAQLGGSNSSSNSSSFDTSTSFEFQMFNAVLGVDAQCSTHVNQTAAGDAAAAATAAATWHDCFVESRDTRITAAFRFDLQRHELTTNETWVCDDGVVDNNTNKTAAPVTFQALATNSITTLCQETVNADLGQHYCAAVPNVRLPVNVTRIVGGG